MSDPLLEAQAIADAASAPLETKVITIDPRELVLLEVNARYMRHETFYTLVNNIRRDGVLTQFPFGAMIYEPNEPDGEPTGKYEVLSGNHRVKASIEADLAEIQIIVTDQFLTRQERIAHQLSHNAIAGEDDPTILKSLYDELEDVDLRLYSGLDDRTLEMLEAVDLQSLSEANLDFTSVNLTFLPDEIEEAKRVFDDAASVVTADEMWMARWGDYDKFINTLQLAQSSYKVGNTATALMLILRIVEKHKLDMQEGWWNEETETSKHDGLVNLATITGDVYLPAPAAGVIKMALDRMVKAGDVDTHNLVRGLELLAADWLAGQGVDLA